MNEPAEISPEATLQALIEKWQSAVEARDLERLMSLIADDCVFLAPSAPPVRGKEAVEGMFRSLWKSLQEHKQEFTIEEAWISGDCLIGWGVDSATLLPAGSTESLRYAGHGVMILKRAPSGEWKFARGINNMIRIP